MDYSTPIKKLLWTNNIKSPADVQLFICHLLLDLKTPFNMADSFVDFGDHESNRAFTEKAAGEYDDLMAKSYDINGGYMGGVINRLLPELYKWMFDDNDDPIKSLEAKNFKTGKIMYKIEYKSDFPIMSILYAVDYSTGKKQYKKVGSGTIVDWDYVDVDNNNYSTDYVYKLYDSEAKKYLTGIITKDPNGKLSFTIDFIDEW